MRDFFIKWLIQDFVEDEPIMLKLHNIYRFKSFLLHSCNPPMQKIHMNILVIFNKMKTILIVFTDFVIGLRLPFLNRFPQTF